jgi:hypothetical protein
MGVSRSISDLDLFGFQGFYGHAQRTTSDPTRSGPGRQDEKNLHLEAPTWDLYKFIEYRNVVVENEPHNLYVRHISLATMIIRRQSTNSRLSREHTKYETFEQQHGAEHVHKTEEVQVERYWICQYFA